MIKHDGVISRISHFFALFGSFSTLFCCALPALFVALWAGATLAGIVTTIPQLVWISDHKTALFIFAAVMLTLSGISQYMNRNAPCPSDPQMAKSCTQTRKISRGVFLFSLTMYAIGFYFAFIAKYFA